MMTIEDQFKKLEEGAFEYFSIEHRRSHLSPWNKPNEPLTPVEDLLDSFGKPESTEWDSGVIKDLVAEPWIGTGNNYKPKYKFSHDEKHSVWAQTGGCGWWTLKYAVLAVRRLRKASKLGKLNYADGYGKVTQAVRYEFRVVKISVSKKVELVSCDELIDSLVGTSE
jgi:hypothetical protein